MYYTVIKHDGHLRTRGKYMYIYIFRVFSNVRSVLSQCNTLLRLLHLLYNIDFVIQILRSQNNKTRLFCVLCKQ